MKMSGFFNFNNLLGHRSVRAGGLGAILAGAEWQAAILTGWCCATKKLFFKLPTVQFTIHYFWTSYGARNIFFVLGPILSGAEWQATILTGWCCAAKIISIF
jgi:hypothetical protein